MSLVDHWPLLGLRIETPNLELRTPTDADLEALADLVSNGVHRPETMPFTTEWTDADSPELERGALQYWWRCRADFSPKQWDVPLAVVNGGTIVGVQGLAANEFPTLRTAETGSWLGLAHQGQGIGKEMRRAVLHFGFECLGAKAITSAAYTDNPASQKVSLATGYQPNGINVVQRRGDRAEQIRYILTRDRWEEVSAESDVRVEGFDACREMFGLQGDE
jgi:RimJ/RimL family protein N-acetyltransferase